MNKKTDKKKNTIDMIEFLRFILAIVLFSSLASCGGTKKLVDNEPQSINSYAFDFVDSDELASVLKKAERENKLVFVDVYTTWCMPCRLMDRDVFTHQETADVINKDFISYKIDAEKKNGPVFSFNYDVVQYPTLLFLDAKGNILERKDGVAYHSELLSMAQRALDQVMVGE